MKKSDKYYLSPSLTRMCEEAFVPSVVSRTIYHITFWTNINYSRL